MQSFLLTILTKLKRVLSSAQLSLMSKPRIAQRLFPLLAKDGQTISHTSAIHFELFQASIVPVSGMLSDEESSLLFYLSATSPLKGDIVEIGSWLGRSTVHLAAGCKVADNGVVHAIDTFQGNPGKESLYTAPLAKEETILKRFKKNIKLAGLSGFVKTHPGTSESNRPHVKKKMRLIFIDACHEYEGILLDIKLWRSQVMTGGLLIFDDFEPTFPGVVQAVNEQIIASKEYRVLFVYKALCVCQRVA